jgi:nitrogen fixation protein NifU and related proteins
MDIYREVILDHYKNPRNFGHLKQPDSVISEDNVTCGDKIIMEIQVNKKNIVEDIRFSGVGCAISQASASMLTEEVKGKTTKEIMALGAADILSMLGTTLTPSRTKCATLSLEVLQKSVLALKRT